MTFSIKKLLSASLLSIMSISHIPSCLQAEMPVLAEDAMGKIIHPVSTKNPEVQKLFDTGLTYIFAFNHDFAFKSFEKASQLDPDLGMAYWGMALALGQNINQDVTPENEIRAYGYSQKALSLLSKASPNEQAYIKALATRYTNDPKVNLVALRYDYRDAMKKVAEAYPEDLDASCLYAESLLNLDPWKYWTWDGKPTPDALQVIDILESILNRNPDHIGANHYYIHAWEESPTPERALMSAFRLSSLLPESGHLMHMPCHIFILCGYYEEAIKVNTKAIAADRQYIKENGMSGEYPRHYLSHNLNILARTYMLAEQYEKAINAANELNQFLAPYYDKMEHYARFMIVPMEVNLYFHRWKELLAYKPEVDKYPQVQTWWHFSRAMAQINLGDYPAFQSERRLMNESRQKINPELQIANNQAIRVFEIADLLLGAAEAKYQKDEASKLEHLNRAVDIQMRLNYDEPPAWFMPIKSQLGKALLENKNPALAETTFKQALQQFQRNGRLLFGLTESLKAQEKNWDAFWVEREMQAALKNASPPLNLEKL